jgi:hypothetical protein
MMEKRLEPSRILGSFGFMILFRFLIDLITREIFRFKIH